MMTPYADPAISTPDGPLTADDWDHGVNVPIVVKMKPRAAVEVAYDEYDGWRLHVFYRYKDQREEWGEYADTKVGGFLLWIDRRGYPLTAVLDLDEFDKWGELADFDPSALPLGPQVMAAYAEWRQKVRQIVEQAASTFGMPVEAMVRAMVLASR